MLHAFLEYTKTTLIHMKCTEELTKALLYKLNISFYSCKVKLHSLIQKVTERSELSTQINMHNNYRTRAETSSSTSKACESLTNSAAEM